MPIVIGGDNLPSPVGIGSTDLPNLLALLILTYVELMRILFLLQDIVTYAENAKIFL